MTPRTHRARALVGALTGLATAAALPAAAAADTDITMKLRDRVVGHGASVVATGAVEGARAGRQVLLQHAAADGAYRTIAAGRTAAGGRYVLKAALQRSGRVRVLERPASAGAAAAGTGSVPAFVTVAARVVDLTRRTSVVAGRKATVRGEVRPALAGLRVELQRRSGGRWQTIDRDTTSRGGAFALARRVARPGVQRVRLRVRRTPDGIAGGRRSLGTIEGYRRALVSWYGPGLYGNPLGCGGTLHPGTIGVAHKSLPCGTKLVLRHGGREVKASVIDRGPYVGAREFDLTQATKHRLRFSGVGTILVAPRRGA